VEDRTLYSSRSSSTSPIRRFLEETNMNLCVPVGPYAGMSKTYCCLAKVSTSGGGSYSVNRSSSQALCSSLDKLLTEPHGELWVDTVGYMLGDCSKTQTYELTIFVVKEHQKLFRLGTFWSYWYCTLAGQICLFVLFKTSI